MPKKMKRFFSLFLLLAVWHLFCAPHASISAAAYPYQIHGNANGETELMPVVGFIDSHRVQEGQTLLEIARQHGLGYNEIVLYHPEIDPWMPEEGRKIGIPGKWVLPPTKHQEVVINIPEMRLYRFFQDVNMVRTYPIGIGRAGFDTPVKETRVVQRVEDPSWTVPPDAIERYGTGVLPPGPDNPLGDYWVGLSESQLGIHGTNVPWGIGRKVSRGCIRLYPEHIERFYQETEIGTRVEIIYEPVKIGVRGELIFLEVHPDIYGRISDMEAHAWEIIEEKGLKDRVDPQKVSRGLEEKRGVPVPVSN